MKKLKYLLVLLLTLSFSSALSLEELKSLSTKDTRSMKLVVERITFTGASVEKIIEGLTYLVKDGMGSEEYKFPEENVKRVKGSIVLIKQDIKNLNALMQGKTFDTWEADKVSIEKYHVN